ncbi:GIY-YIG nuclease family protein [Prevotella communis]|uniref:GIY-YIG nuclease family protein n=1 Tax=Prevotella communis TaxID=2913614 RepID=UPI001EDC698E|nr:GIY-YIG nuclease family protein [Prevotella communis]UKK63313.1 GIY-YIG nuclease family protein [Prevotella communis]UKK66138.1 GIY-YIG nuclease family protein [Prevotella communis]
MATKETGYVYILTNPSFREDWVKIGKSSRPVDVRSKELDNTAVPLPFDIYATMQTEKYSEAEKAIHKQIDRLTDRRIRQNREFFNLEPSLALEIMLDLAQLSPDAVVMKYENGEPHQVYPVMEVVIKQVDQKKEQRPPFDFSMVGLTVGDEIIFDALHLPVKVAGKNKVEYDGRLWSLSAFCGTYLPEKMHNKSEAYQGPKYFSYKGKTLWNIRLEKEKE